MTTKSLMPASLQWKLLRGSNAGRPRQVSHSFVCPYSDCRAYASHLWGVVRNVAAPLGSTQFHERPSSNKHDIWFAQCSACQREVIFVNDDLVWPVESAAPPPESDMPEEIVPDYEEARQIYQKSPRGAAALLRLALQKLCNELVGESLDINTAIGRLVASGRISETIQQALDSLRVIGNEAVHPGTLDLKDDQDTALKLFKLLNFVVEKTISDPKRISEIYGTLPPQKLSGIASRDRALAATRETPSDD